MNRKLIAAMLIIVLPLLTRCKMSSQGDDLELIQGAGAGAVGKTYTLQMEQVNIEIDEKGLYLRVFDKANKAAFLYFTPEMKNRVAALQRDTKYLYKFTVTANDKYPAATKGNLLDIGDTGGNQIKPVAAIEPTALQIRLDGAAAAGKEYKARLKFRELGVNDEKKKYAWFESDDGYGFTVYCYYPDTMEAEVKKLEKGGTYNITLKVTENGINIKGDLAAIAGAK